ncbi:hypothetical protein C7M84_018467 [Penaeus vannamei]|uniref:Uncharacterized protein n=1 Tax=Penaeus vannamei TaxID=6689 RepID=A0A423SHL3_PENVA|nr:hypothetical protein C7M84_018467 [Penaeus vannamei]
MVLFVPVCCPQSQTPRAWNATADLDSRDPTSSPRRRALAQPSLARPLTSPSHGRPRRRIHLPTPMFSTARRCNSGVSAASSAGDYRRTSHRRITCRRSPVLALYIRRVKRRPDRPLVIGRPRSFVHLATLTHHTRCRAVTLCKNCPSACRLVTPSPMLFLSRDDESFRRRDPPDLALKILRSTLTLRRLLVSQNLLDPRWDRRTTRPPKITAPRALRRLPHHAPLRRHRPSTLKINFTRSYKSLPRLSTPASKETLIELCHFKTSDTKHEASLPCCRYSLCAPAAVLNGYCSRLMQQHQSTLPCQYLKKTRSPLTGICLPLTSMSPLTPSAPHSCPVSQTPRAETPLLTLTLGSPRRPLAAPISRTSSPPYHLPTLPCSLLHVAATPAVSAASSAGDYRRTSSPPHHLPTLSCSRVATPAMSAAPTRPLVIAAHVPRASRYAHSPHPLPCW